MTTLLQRCRTVTAKVEQLTLAQRHANQQRQVQERAREWRSRYDALQSLVARVASLSLDAEAQRRLADKRERLRHNSSQVLDRLKSLGDIGELTGDALWTRLLASVVGLAEELEASGKSAWKSYVDAQGVLEAPAWLNNRAPSTPINEAALAAYRGHYRVYSDLVKLPMPRSADDLGQLSTVIAMCRAEAARITFDVPPDVQRFFRAIQSGSATLASVTPDVLTWLADNKQLERYRVQSVAL